jgi:hypothetical protein
MDHLEPVRKWIRAAPISPPLPPWIGLATHAIGGLTGVGFANNSDLLLVVSSQGRGVFDCRTGQRIARDRTEPEVSWCDEYRLRAIGIGPLEGLAGFSRRGYEHCPDGYLYLLPYGKAQDFGQFNRPAVNSTMDNFGHIQPLAFGFAGRDAFYTGPAAELKPCSGAGLDIASSPVLFP